MILNIFGGNISVNASAVVGKVAIKSVDNIDTSTQKITWKKQKSCINSKTIALAKQCIQNGEKRKIEKAKKLKNCDV